LSGEYGYKFLLGEDVGLYPDGGGYIVCELTNGASLL